ncbi:uncharacterized protein PgNI_12448 [Pyricularia grisea]|uniref:Uncharacterized protein n=1 Tax=Pyricularia grisea TaxID=148305 RepID=A0A6P8AME0_PYRGI|nr:uncharacterized protein PgNI_12448 [Pyricularia grisea]TLD03210.1 hypothetical protein PgNI_12448 [Pyricularia grisea]
MLHWSDWVRRSDQLMDMRRDTHHSGVTIPPDLVLSTLVPSQIISINNHQKSPVPVPRFPQIVFKTLNYLRVHHLVMQNVAVIRLDRLMITHQQRALRAGADEVPSDLLVLLRHDLEVLKGRHFPGQGRVLALSEELRLGLGLLSVGTERAFVVLKPRDDALDMG